MKIVKTNQLLNVMLIFLLFASCNKENSTFNPDPIPITPQPGVDVVQIPIVVHVIHSGEPIGQGANLSTERIVRQIEILNEDFRRQKNTRGYNDHPDGGDAMMEFVLARQTPNGQPTNGINRINALQDSVPNLGYNQNHFAQHAYWNPNWYVNVWTTPLPIEAECLALGVATGPETDLPGTEQMSLPGPGDAEGILINWIHFGESGIDCHAKYGRTLTHEMGHYFGLLHPWGDRECNFNDFCDDTPAVDKEVYGNSPFPGCEGESIMIENFMNYSDDEVMNTFTLDQIGRMHYVLTNHAGRNSLLTSKGLENL